MPRYILVNRYFHPDESSTSQFLTDLARHLATRNEVVVLTSRQLLEDPAAGLPASGEIDGARIRRLWSTAWGRQWLPGRMLDYLSFLAAVGLWLLLHARPSDVVLTKTDPPLLGVAATLATLGRGTRRVQWVQDIFPDAATRLGIVGRKSWLARVVAFLNHLSLRRSALVVTASPGMAAQLAPTVGSERLVHIPNWADDFGPSEGRTPAAPGRGLVIGYSGNLGRAHPIDGLLQLAERATDSALQFVLSGGGVHHQRLRERVQQLGRTNWTFLPYQPRERLAELLRRPDLHLVVLDPRVEGCMFPSKVYGILSAGQPILHLGDPEGEVARLLRHHRCGWSLPAHDGARILELLEQLCRDTPALVEAGRNARLAYERCYSRSLALKRWDDVLERV